MKPDRETWITLDHLQEFHAAGATRAEFSELEGKFWGQHPDVSPGEVEVFRVSTSGVVVWSDMTPVEILYKALWPQGPQCQRCGAGGWAASYAIRRSGVRRCTTCHAEFSLRRGTAMASSPLTLGVWAKAFSILATLAAIRPCDFAHRMAEVNYKTAILMHRRIREDTTTLTKVRKVMKELETRL